MSYSKVKIADLCSLVTSGGTPLTSVPAYYAPKEIPWLKTGEVNYCRIYDTESYISKEGLARSSAKMIPANSVVVAMYGQGDTAGRVAINKIPLSTNQACCNLVINHEIADYEYVYYALCTLYDHLVALKNGGAQPNLNAKIIKAIEIPFPDLETQHRIASALGAYDDLIESNQKQIKLLEEAAQRLYKEWFVDLRFPRYEDTPIVDGLPEGWKRVPLSELISYEIGGGWGEEFPTTQNTKEAYVIRGTDLYGITHGDLLSIPCRFHAEHNLSSRTLVDGDIVFEVSGGSRTEGVARCLLITSAMLDKWRNNVMCASFCKLIRPRIGYSYYLHDYFKHMRATGKTEEYDKRSASSIVNYRWKDFLAQELLYNPSSEIIEQYSNYSRAIYDKLVDCSLQIFSAEKARDHLLPKLMSGEIEV